MIDVRRDRDPSAYDKYNSSISNDNVGLSIHAPDHWQKIVSPIELERLLSTGDHVGIHVLVGDIRKSTFLMKESISLKRFARITRDFMKAVRDTAGKDEGWFDKLQEMDLSFIGFMEMRRTSKNIFHRFYCSLTRCFLFQGSHE